MSENVQPTKSSNPKSSWIGLAVVILIVAGLWLTFNGGSLFQSTPAAESAVESTGLEPAPIAGRPAPDFTLKTLEGQEVSLSDFRGQPVIINFWATWCGPCRIEMPHLQSAYTNNLDNGLVVLGVNLTQRDTTSEIPAFLDEFGLTFPIVLDENGNVANTYKVFGQPASIFVDGDGVIHQVFHGPVNEEYINDRVKELLSS